MTLKLLLGGDALGGAFLATSPPGDAAREVAAADLASSGLVVALDLLGAPAFVADAQGRPAYANRVGAAIFQRDPIGTAQQLRDRIGAGGPRVPPVRASGVRRHWLVVLSPAAVTHEERLSAAARAWRLTKRQTQVLRLAAHGESNKAIAAALGCAEVTVEFHMTALLRRAGAESRAQLVARFWTL